MMDLDKGHTRRIIRVASQEGLSLAQTAYVLATAWHETAHTMEPVEEAFYLGAKAKAYRQGLRYYPWHGRGFVQLTWRENYERAGRILGVDLTTDPSRAMDPDIAASVLVSGMKHGWFTGVGLENYINASKVDFHNARRIVNGTDKAAEIAALARQYQNALASEGYPPRAAKVPIDNVTSDGKAVIIAIIVALIAAAYFFIGG